MATNPTANPYDVSGVVARRLGMVPGAGMPAPLVAGAPAAAPGGPTAPTSPALSPTDQPPGANVSATPAVDLNGALSRIQPSFDQGGDGVQGAVGRALIGFSRGMAATPKEAYGSPALAGIEGGLAGTGEGILQQRAMQWQLDEPRRAIVQKMLETQAEQSVKDPYENAQEARRQAGRLELQDRKLDAMKNLLDDRVSAAAQNHGISVEDELRLRKEAGKNAMAAGLDFDSPNYAAFIDQETARLAQQAKDMGVHGITVPRVPARTNRPAPKTAADYLSSQ